MNYKLKKTASTFSHISFRSDYPKVIVIALAYFFAHQLAFFFPDSEKIIMLIWPAGGIGLAAFLMNPRRLWPVLTLAFYISGIAADVLLGGRSFMTGLGYMTGNMVESIGCAWLIIHWSGDFRQFSRVREVLGLIAGALLVNALSSCIGAGTSVLTRGANFFEAWSSWYISDGLGILVIGPFILVWIKRNTGTITDFNLRKIFEWVAFVIIWSFLSIAVFYRTELDKIFEFHPYLLVAFLTWSAIRLGQKGVTLALILLFIIAIVSPSIVPGPTPWGGINHNPGLAHRLFELQMFLGFLAITGYLMAAGYASLKRVEETLRESEERYRSMVRILPDGVIIHSEGKIVYANESACKIMKFENNEKILGLPAIDFVHPDYREIAIQRIKESMVKHKTAEAIEEIFIAYDNTPVQVLVTAIPFQYSGKLSMLTVFTDITERKKAEEELRKKSEELDSYFNNAIDLFCIANSDGYFLKLNKEWENTLGYKLEELEGKRFLDLIHPDDLESTLIRMSHLSENRDVRNFINRYKSKDGSYRIFEWRSKPSGKLIYSAARDITERKLAEKALKESEEKFRNLVENMQEGVIQVDNHDVIKFVNPRFCELLGYDESELLGKVGYETIIFEEDRETIKEKNLNRLSGMYEHYELTMKKKSDSAIYFLMSASPVINQEGIVTGSMSVCTDITDRKQAEAEIQKKNIELAELNASKDKFFSIIAHDLKSPFNGFLGLTKIMAEEIQNLTMSEMQEYSHVMQSTAQTLYKLLENLLEWSKIQRGLTQFEPESCILFLIVRENIDIVSEFVKKKNIEVITKIPVYMQVTADIPMLNTVFRNLISNAVKFTPRGGKIEVGIADSKLSESSELSKHCIIYIRDSGIGMSTDIIENLFKLDRKISRPGTENEPSSGLGLLLSKEFIEKHGGRIWVESQEGQGTTFYFSLPKNYHNKNEII
ncbi:MAG: Signal transduction histidine kinase [Ignavibacteria bacterium]|nr:Signal transduction histidine kinase [Ignavibacteria bacterium]